MEKDNKKVLYESIMTSIAREIKKVLNRQNEFDFNENLNENYIAGKDKDLNQIQDNIIKMLVTSLNDIFEKNKELLVNVMITAKNKNIKNYIGKTISPGHITGLLIEETIIRLLAKSINIKNVKLEQTPDNYPIYDLKITDIKNNKEYKVQIKAVLSKNEGRKEMNDIIRKDNDLAIIITYIMDKTTIKMKTIQIYLPDENSKDFTYISREWKDKQKLKLNRDLSLVTIGE